MIREVVSMLVSWLIFEIWRVFDTARLSLDAPHFKSSVDTSGC